MSQKKFKITLFSVLIAGLLLPGCNNSQQNQQTSLPTSQKIQAFKKEAILTGKVSNKKQPITSGIVQAKDRHHKLVASTTLEKSSHYRIKIPAGTELPIVLSVLDETQNDRLISVVISKSFSKYDINELTTAIAKKAKELGGYSYANIALASSNTVHVPDANKTSTGFRGDPTAQYGGWH